LVTSSGSEKQRKLIRQPAYAQDIERIRHGSERAAEAVAAFERVITKIPEQGMAVPGGRPGIRSFPFHTDHGSYLVLYTFDARKVVCLAVRPVRSGIF
jgi:hypothetical protein